MADTDSGQAAVNAACGNPPRLNERVFIRRYDFTGSDANVASQAKGLRNHADTIRKCGLTPELVAENGQQLQLYAARRRPRNEHD